MWDRGYIFAICASFIGSRLVVSAPRGVVQVVVLGLIVFREDAMQAHQHQVVLLSSTFKDPEQRLFFTRARLFFDRIEFSGWHLGKRYQREILLDELDNIEWNTARVAPSAATFHLSTGRHITVQLSQLDRWKHSLEDRLNWSFRNRYPVATTATTTTCPDLSLHELVAFTTSMG